MIITCFLSSTMKIENVMTVHRSSNGMKHRSRLCLYFNGKQLLFLMWSFNTIVCKMISSNCLANKIIRKKGGISNLANFFSFHKLWAKVHPNRLQAFLVCDIYIYRITQLEFILYVYIYKKKLAGLKKSASFL
jgi:hypothetical protein